MTLEDRATSLARIRRNQVGFGGDIDPAYVNNQRVYVHMDGGGFLVLLAPEGMVIHPGDRVSAQTTYRNPKLPCAYVPNLITADLGPSPRAAEPRQGDPPAKSAATGSPPTP